MEAPPIKSLTNKNPTNYLIITPKIKKPYSRIIRSLNKFQISQRTKMSSNRIMALKIINRKISIPRRIIKEILTEKMQFRIRRKLKILNILKKVIRI